MGLPNEGRHYVVTPPVIGQAPTQKDPYVCYPDQYGHVL